MSNISEIRKNRIKKLQAIQRAGFSAYPSQTKRTHTCQDVIDSFSKIKGSKKEIILVGRIRSLREHGKSTFIHIEDATVQCQAYFKENVLGEKGYKFFLQNFDIGDFIEIRGTLFKTKKGEKTLEVSDYKMLVKSLLPLPEKWHGLKDVEERYRKRYLDLIFNKEIKEKFELRTKVIKEIREFLDKEGFLEVETPILQEIYGGAAAKPFKTHLNALDIDLYLRISLELYLKRLLVGGFEKVYEIGKCFRNEGVDKAHNPDFTMLEFYWGYADYKEMMKLTETLLSSLIKKTVNKLEIKYQDKKINFKTPWPRIEYNQLFKKHTKINLETVNLLTLKKKAQSLDIKIEKGDGKIEIADKIYKKACLPEIWQPTFVINHPAGSTPLAKSLDKNSSKLAMFQLVVAGWEIVKAFSELNDPIEQKKRFEEQEKFFKKGLKEAQRMDNDFVEALEYGMPPASGLGMGIDRLVVLLTDSHSLREIILFPIMRPK